MHQIIPETAGERPNTGAVALSSQPAWAESPEDFRILFAHSADAILLLREVCEDCNEQALQLFGCSRQELLGRSLADFSPPYQPNGQLSSSAIAARMKTALNGIPQRFEWLHRRRSGTLVPTDVSLTSVQLRGETHLLATLRDITEWKEVEAMLRQSEERFRILFECAPDAFYLVDLEGRFVDANQAAWALTGYAKEEVVGRSFAEVGLLPADQVSVALARLARNTAGEAPGPSELRLRRKDGAEIYVEINTHPVEIGGRTLVLGNVRDITARKLAEARLRRSETSLRLAQHVGQMGSWELDLSGQALEWSEETYRIFGCDPAVFRPTRSAFYSFVHPEDRARVEHASRDALRTGKAYQIEHRIRRADGGERTVSEQADVILDEKGLPVRMVGVVQDITERKVMQEKLRESEEHYRRLIHASPDGIALMDLEGRLLYASPRMYEIFNAPLDQSFLGRSVLEWVAPEHRARALEGLRQLLSSKQPGAPEEYRLLKVDGSPFWGELSSTPVLDANGQVKGTMTICRDATARKEVEARLAEQAALLDTANDAILVGDLEHRIRYWNKGAERLYGWTAAEAINQSASELLHADLHQFETSFRQVLEQGDWTGELEQKTKAGQPITVLSRWTAVRGENGEPKSVFIINTDIAERKRLEAQFLRAQRLESIGQLASGIAHDLNNILLPTTMVIPMLREHIHDPNILKLLELVEKSTQRGAAIVRQVLTFSRGNPGERMPIQSQQILEEVAGIIRETFPRSITLQTRWPADLPMTVGDPTQLHQVLMNLSVNARDAMPEGGTLVLAAETTVVDQVFASTMPNAKAGQYLVWTVADSGTGIPPQDLDRIFDPFFTTKEVGKGTGLGLSTVLGIVRDHDGFIQVQSSAGRGAHFRVYLPVTPVSALTVNAASAEMPRGNGELVLLVDDEEGIRAAGKRLLEQNGYRVLLASEGSEALDIIARRSPAIDVVLTDLMMPQMDGLMLIRKLRLLAPEMKTIVATGLDAGPYVSQLPELGVRTVLRKPFSPQVLLQKLRSALDH